MDDASLIEAFESCTIPAAEFRHAQHVQLTYAYLARHPLPTVLAKLREGLLRFATAHGVPEKYHETITFAFAALINERRKRSGACDSFAEFKAENPDLFEKSLLESYYRPETLKSRAAREFFILPDAIALG